MDQHENQLYALMMKEKIVTKKVLWSISKQYDVLK